LPATGVLSALMGAQVALFLGCAFMVPFHPLKRGLHDLVAGSIVVKGGMPSAEIIARGDRPRRDRWLLGGAGALVVGATVVGASLGYLSQSFKQMVAVVQTLKKMGIQSPNVTHSFFRGDGGSRHAIFASGFIPPPGDGEPTVSDLQQEILTAIRRDVSLDGVDQIGVTLSWGINLGIYRSSSGVTLVEPVRRE